MLVTTLALGGLVTVGSAHMLMANPVPYDKKNLDNGPLKSDGTDYPCKFSGDRYGPVGPGNVYKQGATGQLQFIGSAVHGGGSCQVSITTDLKPTKNSVFKVIKSIQGGCPAKNQAGNMGTNAEAIDPYKYDFTIPKELAARNYTLAWTWFNKVGNREMYMNCAPVTVTGSEGSKDFLDSLPDMFVANLGAFSNNCETTEGTDVRFPDAGQDVDSFGDPKLLLDPVVAKGGRCPVGKAGNKTGQPPSTTQREGNTGNSPTDAPAYPDSSHKAGNKTSRPRPSTPGAIFKTIISSDAQPTTPPTSAAVQPTSRVPKPTAQTTTGSGPANGTVPSGAHAAGTPCSTEGAWNCIGGSSFQRCASGVWSEAEPVAQGTSCTPGESSVIRMGGTRKTRRALHRALRRSHRFVA